MINLKIWWAQVPKEIAPMQNAYIVTGTLTNAQTVALDEALPMIPAKRVRLVVEPLLTKSERPYQEVLSEIRKRQQDRGHHPSVKEEVDMYLQSERSNWE
jgi:hypothetical protein